MKSQKICQTGHKNYQKPPPTSQTGGCAMSAGKKQAIIKPSLCQSSGAKNGLDYWDGLRNQLEVLKQEHAANTDSFNVA